RAAGSNGRSVISDEAIDTLARGARGIPRLLNRAAERAFELAAAAEADHVDVEAAMEALALVGLERDSESPEQQETGVSTLELDRGSNLAAAQAGSGSIASWGEKPKKEARTGVPEVTRELNRARRLFAVPRKPA